MAYDFGISEQAVSKILERSSHWLSESESTAAISKRDRKSAFPEIEEAIIDLIDQMPHISDPLNAKKFIIEL